MLPKERDNTWPEEPAETHDTTGKPSSGQYKTAAEGIWDTQKQFWEKK